MAASLGLSNHCLGEVGEGVMGGPLEVSEEFAGLGLGGGTH